VGLSALMFARFKLFTLVLTGIMFLCFVKVVSASEDDDQTIIITATREPANAATTIGNIDKISAVEIQTVSHNHIQELLVRVPGVNLQRGNGHESLPAIRSPVLTGAGACGAFLMAEDNIPLRAAGFCNINELFEAHTEQARSIEVIRGPGSAFYGSNALHGIINVLTPEVPDEKRFQLAMEAGAYNFTRVKTAFGNSDNTQGYNLALTVDNDGGYRDQSGYAQQKFSGRYDYSSEHLAVKSAITLTNLEQETAGFIVGKDSYLDKELARSNLNPEAYRNAESLRFWTQFDYQLSDQQHLQFTPYYRHTDMAFMMHFLPGRPLEENGQDSIGFQSAWYSDNTKPLHFILGVDAEKTQGYMKQTQENPTEGSAFLQATIPVGKHYDYEVDGTLLAPFIHVDWQFAEFWKIIAGVRYERMSYDYNNLMLDGRTRDDGTNCGFGGCRYSRPEDSKNTFNNLSPKLGVSYQMNDNSLIFMNLTKGFRAPQATELYRLQRAQTIADLDSVAAISQEIGIRQFSADLNYEIVYYQMNKDNVIYRDSNYFNRSNGETKHRGIEARFDYAVNDGFNIGFNASLARHSYVHEQLLGDINIKGNRVDSAPEHFGSVHFDWKITSSIKTQLEWLHQGAYFTDAENLHSYAGHNLLNLRARWELNKQWYLSARINNLTDERYAERADYTVFSGDRYFPGMPTTFFVGIQFRN